MNREYWNVLTKQEKRYFKKTESLPYDSVLGLGQVFSFFLKTFFYSNVFIMVFFIFIRDYSDKINVPYVEICQLIFAEFEFMLWLSVLGGLVVLSILILNEILKLRYIKKNNINIKFQKVNVEREKKKLEEIK